jgi:hypothetical protein
MAKFDEGDEIRLKKNMEFGNGIQIRKNTKGTIKQIKKKAFGKNEYVVRWNGINFDLTMQGESNISRSGDEAW